MFRFRGIRKHPDQACYIAQCGKDQLIFEDCDSVADLRKAVREKFNDEDDNFLALALLALALKQPQPLAWLKSIEGKRISLDLAAAVKIEEPT